MSVSLLIAIAMQGSVASDSRLVAKADFDLSLTQITDAVARFSEITKVPLSVEKRSADLKVDIFCEGQPVGVVMDRMATVFNAHWVKAGKGYRLEADVTSTNQERNFCSAEDAIAKKNAVALVEAAKYAARITPPDPNSDKKTGMFPPAKRFALLKPFMDEMEAAQRDGAKNPARIEDAQRQFSAMQRSIGMVDMTSIGRVFLRMSDSEMDSFWKGTPLVASTFPKAQYHIDPSDYKGALGMSVVDANGQQATVQPEVFDIIRFKPLTGKISASFNSFAVHPNGTGRGGSSHSSGGFASSSAYVEIPATLKKLPFYAELEPWTDSKTTSGRFSQKVDVTTKTWSSPWFTGHRRLGDHLRWFHLATGIPVVAQADHSCTWQWVRLNRTFTDAATYIQHLMEDTQAFCKEDQGFLLARNFRYWTHRRHEAPEAVWKSFESQKAPRPLSFYLKVANAFREDQLISDETYYPLATFEVSQFSYSYDSLRFLSLLSTSQFNSVQSDGGLEFSDLTESQSDAAVDTVIKMLSESGSCSFGLAKAIVERGIANQELRAMRVKMTGNDFRNWIHYGMELREGNEIIQKAVQTRGPATQFSIRFGFNDEAYVSQSINIDK